MDDKTLYTKILGLQMPWFVDRVELSELKQRVDVYLKHEDNIRAQCPECKTFYSVYDHGPERIYRHLNTCQMETYVHVRLPRVDCPKDGVRQIQSEFGENGSEMSYAMEKHLIRMLKECSIESVRRLCDIGWHQGWGIVKRAVERGFERKTHRIPRKIGVDEKSFSKGHNYETLVYDNEKGTVEYVCDNREQASLEAYYKEFTCEELGQVESVSMDMWDPYIAATKAFIPKAEEKIVFDRFHVIKQVTAGVDKVRRMEQRELLEQEDRTLTGTKYLWLWNFENIPSHRKIEFSELRRQDLKVGRAWALKENIRHLWDLSSEGWMRRYFRKWYNWAIHSRLKPMQKAAKTLLTHIDNIVTYAKHKITNAMGESINSKIEKVKRLACGYRNREHYKAVIYFHCGGLNMFPKAPEEPTICTKAT